MELLKVFVGDGSTTSGTTVNTMIPGDLLIVDATSHAPLNKTSVIGKEIKIVSCISKNGVNTPVFSTPIKLANVRYSSGVKTVSYNPKIATFTINDSDIVAGGTYSLGIQIKEDLRMGTYNKNTEVIVSHTCPSTVADTPLAVASTLAKGFSANPLTSGGSPYQLVKVERTGSGTITALGTSGTTTFDVVQGGRQVKASGNVTVTDGTVVSISGVLYLVEKGVSAGTIFTLDTGYQGATATITSGNSSTTFGTVATVTADTLALKFTALTLSQKNRYDQFRVVEFDVIYPKGWVDSVMAVTQSTRIPVGSYRQVRDLEEKAYTNSNPLINYREFPFEDFALNANSSTSTYSLVTLAYTSDWGYNMMQSNQSEFLQTAVIAAPASANGDFDYLSSSETFLQTLYAWLGSSVTNGTFDFV